MAQTTIQGSFLGDATVTGAKIGADFISAQTELTTSLATADEIIVSDAGVIKRIDISVWSASTETFTNKTLTAPIINAGTLNLMTVLTVANDIDVGAFEIKALKFESDQATGTAPLTVASTTVVTNLNADLLDGVQGALYSQITATETLSSKSIDLGTNTLTGSVAEFNAALQSESFATLTGSETLASKTLTSPVLNTGVSGSAVLDSDAMSGVSATTLASSESIKAYVDANAGGDFYDTITNGTSKIYVDNNASSGFSLVNNYKFQINMPTSGEGFFFKCADQGSEHSAIFYADYPSQITKICGSSKWQPLVGGQTGSSGDGKFYIVCDANSRAIWIYNREGNDRTITIHGMGRIVSITAQAAI